MRVDNIIEYRVFHDIYYNGQILIGGDNVESIT